MMHCTNKIYTDNKLRSYSFTGIKDQEMTLDKDQVKDLIKREKLKVDNLHITNNNRLVQKANRIDVNIHDIGCNSIIRLYHGQKWPDVRPTFGLGEDKHDYGKGFYTTRDIGLACEWAQMFENINKQYVYAYNLDVSRLNILNLDKLDDLNWIAELLQHRWPKSSKRLEYRRQEIIKRYKINTSGYDLIVGWRADQSYFRIATAFLNDKISIQQLRMLLKTGNLGIQYTIKQKKAFDQIQCIGRKELNAVEVNKYKYMYNDRDNKARDYLQQFMDDILPPESILIRDLLGEG